MSDRDKKKNGRADVRRSVSLTRGFLHTRIQWSTHHKDCLQAVWQRIKVPLRNLPDRSCEFAFGQGFEVSEGVFWDLAVFSIQF